MMNTNNGLLNSFMNRFDSSAYSAGRFNLSSGSYTKNESTDITIVTDDGDRVTISSDSSMEAGYSSYSTLLRSGSNSIMAEGYEYQSRLKSNFSLSIVGDLDSREYDDIMSALETIDSIMEKAFSGSLGDIEAIAQSFGGLESLSSLSASIEVSEAVSYEQVQSSMVSAGENSQNIPQLAGDMKNLDNALSKILGSGKKNGQSDQKIMSLVDDYLLELLDLYSGKSDENGQGHKAGKLIKGMTLKGLSGKEGSGAHM